MDLICGVFKGDSLGELILKGVDDDCNLRKMDKR